MEIVGVSIVFKLIPEITGVKISSSGNNSCKNWLFAKQLKVYLSRATHRSSLASLHSHISTVTLSTLEGNQRITGLISTIYKQYHSLVEAYTLIFVTRHYML